VADGPYCELLAEDLGLKPTTVRTGLFGEPKTRCLEVVEWLLRHEPDDAGRRGELLIAWAKKRRAGAFREDEDAERWLARRIGEYWAERPEKLAETLREALADNNGRS
jgi:hypothetical protein